MARKNVGWIKFKADLCEQIPFIQLASKCGITTIVALASLYQVACYFRTHGKHGVLNAPPEILDRLLGVDGFARELMSVGWMVHTVNGLQLKSFTDVSGIRKCLGKNVRELLLRDASCAACNSKERLVIDHKIPVSRGGHSNVSNLQPLCWSCNSSKGTKTMEEFLRDR